MATIRFSDPVQLSQKIRHVDHSEVDGHLFIEVVLAGLGLKNAAELARLLPVAAAVLSRIRTGRAVSDDMLLKLHLAFGLSIAGLKDLLCACYRSSGGITVQRIDALTNTAVFAQRAMAAQAGRAQHHTEQHQSV